MFYFLVNNTVLNLSLKHISLYNYVSNPCVEIESDLDIYL